MQSVRHFFRVWLMGFWSSRSVFRMPKEPWVCLPSAAAASLQSCPTLCDPIDGSPPGSPVPGTLQARTLEWVAISFSSAGKWNVKVKSLSRVWLLATPWTAANQAPPSMGFFRQEYWSGLHCLLHSFCYDVNVLLIPIFVENQTCLPSAHLENRMLSEISQTQKDTGCLNSLVWRS